MVVSERWWSDACSEHLPVSQAGSLWRSNGPGAAPLPAQGWKLHVAATIDTAGTVLERVSQVAADHGVAMKGPARIDVLKRLNCGLFYGYTQVGKAFTLYPDADSTVSVARDLCAATAGVAAPAVPFERRVRPGSPVFARFGAFDATYGGELLDPAGQRVPDRRDRDPDWAVPPDDLFTPPESRVPGPLSTSYRSYACLSQRGKGGVYRAVDLTGTRPRHCIVKEGRAHGEVDVDGHDGRSRLVDEQTALTTLAAAGVAVPAVLASFDAAGHRYLVLEHVAGPSLAEAGRCRPELRSVVEIGARLAHQVARVHRSGLVWRDAKAANVILEAGNRPRLLDFEGAAPAGTPVTSPWGTAGHLPPDWADRRTIDPGQDVHAVGVLLHHLATGVPPPPGRRELPTGNLPHRVAEVLELATSTGPRLSADALADALAELCTG